MRIGVDASCWGNRRGYGRFTQNLLSAMIERDAVNDYVFVVDDATASASPMPDGVEVHRVRVDVPPAVAASATGRRSVRDLARMSLAATRARCDVFFFPASYSYYPVLGTSLVVTVHDAIAEQLPHLVVPTRMARTLWSIKRRAALGQAREVITVSAASEQALTTLLGIAPDRLTVIREAAAPHFRPLEPEQRAPLLEGVGLREGDPYVLYVGGISPHKNLPTLVAAFEQVGRDHPDLRLVLVGETRDDPFLSATESLQATIAASPVGDRIQLTGYVGDDELVALYGGAVALVQPSLGEGFGLTAAEAAACGTPVVASRDHALVELLDGAALFADPYDVAGFATHLDALLRDDALRDQVGRACLALAETWSWDAAADTTVAVLERVAAA